MSSPALSPISAETPAPGGRRAGPLARAERSRRTAEHLRDAADTDDAELRRALNDKVVLLNLPVAEAIAQRYRHRGIPLDDLQQVAYEGLIKAVSRFDVDRGLDFLTFAVPTVRGEVMRYFRDNGWMVRPPRRIQERQRAVQQAVQELGLTGEPTIAEVIDHLGLTRAEYAEVVMAYGAFRPLSLDQPVGSETSTTLGDLVLAEDDDRGLVEARMLLQSLLPALTDREQRVLFLRYHRDLTQREIGEEVGVTQMQVSRILSRAHQTLRRTMTEGPDPVTPTAVAEPAG